MSKYPVLLGDPTNKRPDLLVHSTKEEDAARADGYTIVVQSPVPDPRYATRDPYASMRTSDLNYVPVPILPDITIRMMVGPRLFTSNAEGPYKRPVKLQDRTGLVKWQDTVVCILGRMSIPTDGSMVMLRPGTAFPFDMEDRPYEDILPRTDDVSVRNQILAGITLSIVPNQLDQVGPSAKASQAIPIPVVPVVVEEDRELPVVAPLRPAGTYPPEPAKVPLVLDPVTI